ncbi:Mannose-6-phosphate isomerase [Mycena chlorophos]|uniref:U3 small nucleolar RNA-associated protein 22 n=1 Tax=Mycena chlorophos TaxID=658473 RepID=A0A8H6W8E0_MYCCL|nr:Mannose-6-phosphate isomerase [Mycena chlorophos]
MANPQLFRGAITSSGYIPPQYAYNHWIPQTLFDQISERSGCPNSTNLDCLRSTNVDTLSAVNLNITIEQYQSTFPFQPVVDGTFIIKNPLVQLQDGAVNGEAYLAVINTNEGTRFVSDAVEYDVAQAAELYITLGTPLEQAREVFKDDLFKSNTFKLQIDALLPNVRPKESRIPPLDHFLSDLHAVLSSLSPVAPQHPLDAARKLIKKGVAVPYAMPQPTQETNWKVAFEKPSDILVVGSWANKICVKGKDQVKFGVDLAVEMPSSLFQEKDYLNGRFFHKRAYYLAHLAHEIQHSKTLHVDVVYECAFNNPRLTKLVLQPRNNGSPSDFTKLNAQVCIIPVLAADSPIPLHRLSPAHSNLRLSGDGDSVSGSTPQYNSALLMTMAPKPFLLATFALKEHTPSFGDALALLRVWANQRGFGQGDRLCVRGFDSAGAWWAVLLGMLIFGEEPGSKPSKRRPLGRGLSSYQLFRAALDFLAKHDFENVAVFSKSSDGHRFPHDEYETHHDAVLVDASSTLNVLSSVPLSSLQLLQHDARQTLEALDSASKADPFSGVFLKDQRDLASRFDIVLRVDIASLQPRAMSAITTLDNGSIVNASISAMIHTLRQGLGNRVKAIAVLHAGSAARPLAQALPTDPNIIYFGLILDTQHAFRLVDHGPAADEQDASIGAQFHEFWGDKAELRRFKDGRIVESVVWDVTSADERAHVPAMIARHLLRRHFGIEDVQSWQSGFDAVLRLPENVSRVYAAGEVTAGFKGAVAAFDGLVRELKALNDNLPLSIAAVSATSEYLRYTAVLASVPLTASLATALPSNAQYFPSMSLVLQFEKSAKWPDELRAIQKIKLAFFERIADSLMSAVPGLKAAVVIGESPSEIQDSARLEVITVDGWAFSLSIWHDREATLLDRLIAGTNAQPHIKRAAEKKKTKEQHQAAAAKEVYLRRFVHAPRHHRAIVALHHRFPAYAGTVRLVKRWLASHWVLRGHVTDEVVELICASAFVGDGRDLSVDPETPIVERASVPGTKERGFATVVRFLVDWKWEDGLFVPLYGGEAVDLGALPALANAGPGVWRISTEADSEGNMWTLHGPDLTVALRIRALAAATWECLQGMEVGKLTVQSLFLHPTEDYDFVVHLDPAVLPRDAQKVDLASKTANRYANLPLSQPSLGLRAGFDPAGLLFDDLQRVYANTFKPFYDPFGGEMVGGVWDPTLKEPRAFRVMGSFSCAPVLQENGKDRGLVGLNEAGVLSEIARLGAGIVTGITVQL